MSSYRIILSNSLTHHGIKGMHWGERNGPPYPLNVSQYSVSEKMEQNSNDRKYVVTKSTMPFKKYDNVPDIRESYKGINPNKNKNTLLKEVNFKMISDDGKPLSDVNCQSCAFTEEMKQRGYRGISQLIDTRNISDEFALKKLYKNPNIENKTVSSWDNVSDSIKGINGERGNLTINTKGGKHTLRYEIFRNKPIITDPQIEIVFDADNKTVWEDFYNCDNMEIMKCRTDSLQLNDIEFIKKYFAEI